MKGVDLVGLGDHGIRGLHCALRHGESIFFKLEGKFSVEVVR